MGSTTRTKFHCVVFLALTFALACPFWFLTAQPGIDPVMRDRLIVAQMWCPGIAALALTFLFNEKPGLFGWRLGQARFLAAGYLIPIGYCLVAYSVIWLTGLGLFPNPSAVSDVARQFPTVPPALAMALWWLMVGTVLMLPAAFAALGEEIGWRGYLVPRLNRVAGPTAAGWLSGAVWALWHYPSIFFAGYHSAAPIWFGVLMFTIMVVALSFVMVWLRLQSGSIWPCVLLHASHNNFIQYCFTPLTGERAYTAYFIDEFGLGLAITVPLVAYVIWRNLLKKIR